MAKKVKRLNSLQQAECLNRVERRKCNMVWDMRRTTRGSVKKL